MQLVFSLPQQRNHLVLRMNTSNRGGGDNGSANASRTCPPLVRAGARNGGSGSGKRIRPEQLHGYTCSELVRYVSINGLGDRLFASVLANDDAGRLLFHNGRGQMATRFMIGLTAQPVDAAERRQQLRHKLALTRAAAHVQACIALYEAEQPQPQLQQRRRPMFAASESEPMQRDSAVFAISACMRRTRHSDACNGPDDEAMFFGACYAIVLAALRARMVASACAAKVAAAEAAAAAAAAQQQQQQQPRVVNTWNVYAFRQLFDPAEAGVSPAPSL